MITFQEGEAICLHYQKLVFEKTLNGRKPNITEVPEENKLVRREDSFSVLMDVRYDSAYPNNFCDIWYAGYQDGKKRPTVFDFHGGGMIFGDKSFGDPLAVKGEGGLQEEFLKAGFNYVECNYCLAPEYRFPAQVIQVNEVIRFFIDHPEYDLDMSQIVVTGGSAGACLTEIYGLAVAEPSYAEKLGFVPAISMKELSCVIINEACLQQDLNNTNDNMLAMLGTWIGEEDYLNSEKTRLANVSQNIRGLYPPAFLIASNNEPFFAADVRAMDDVLTKYGLAHECYDEPEERELLKHGFLNEFRTSPCAKECFERMMEFLRKYAG